jgi:transposase
MVDTNDDPNGKLPRRFEVITGADRHRRWSREAKVGIVAESFAPGAMVTAVARRHDLRPQQVHAWRRLAREGRLALAGENGMSFARVVVSGASSTGSSSAAPIEISLGEVVVRVRGRVERIELDVVLGAVKALA